MKILRNILLGFILITVCNHADAHTIDPSIGSVGLGRVFVGPAMPFGMIRPSVDGTSMPNSGWAPIDESIRGFAQVHVSGTGGGQKYGNILLMPFTGNASEQRPLTTVDGNGWGVMRTSETIDLGYYACELESAKVEITASDRAAIYQFTYQKDAIPGLAIDAGFFLGYNPVPDQRETQQLVGSQIEIVSDYEIRGYNRVRGGWNNGRAYTVYFYAVSDSKITDYATWRGDDVTDACVQTDCGGLTGALLNFDSHSVKLKIGISYISELKAKQNLLTEIPGWDFDGVRSNAVAAWEKITDKIALADDTPEDLQRMFYTGIYHTMLMPSDRTGENPLWNDRVPYYDDFYAIWDTYRTSTPLITLLEPQREVDIVNSLINIWRRDGFLPDARSGNANGRTQGGSNADIVIADAFAKGLKGIDYEVALDAMLTDADVVPAGNGEAEGRGGLMEYNKLGYVPYGIDRAGNRTVEYSLCDFAIAQLAKGLGKKDIYDRFMRQSGNWRNLWCEDYVHSGSRGFIMPRDADGQWLDSLSYGHSTLHQPKFEYSALMWEGPWYKPWWGMFFYEAPSWEYSLSVPHDVPGLIEACGGPEAFEKRLDTFFDMGYYNVNNEPSFLSPCLYHWIDKPWRSSERIRQIVGANFNGGPQGLPGNDDSGAMSSWLAFHILGLYPNAPSDYYLINAPMVSGWSLALPDGNKFTVEVDNFAPNRARIESVYLNDMPITDYRITHQQILNGGTMKITLAADTMQALVVADTPVDSSQILAKGEGKYLFTFKLHGQTRRYQVKFEHRADSLAMLWGIERNLKWQSGEMVMGPKSIAEGSILNSSMPVDGEHLTLPGYETAYILSKHAYSSLLKDGHCAINGDTFFLTDDQTPGSLHAIGQQEGAEIWVLDDAHFPLIIRMKNNPLEIDWQVTEL